MARFFNFAGFYVGWFTCVGGAARGHVWLGPAVIAVLLLAHFALSTNRAREARLVLTVGLFGFAVDTLQASAGLYAFAGTSSASWLCPPWMVALWALFATTLNSSMAWLAGRYRLAAMLGAVCGPASYAAGARLGAIELPPHAWGSLGCIAIVWTLAMPMLLRLRAALFQGSAAAMVRQTVDVC